MSPTAAAGGKANVYDGFRDAQYTNEGLMSIEEEAQLGLQVNQEILTKQRIVRDPEINAYLQRLGERLVKSSKRQDIPYHFTAIEDNSVNAFALPGGYIYVHTGLLELVQSEDELASAMSHEIGHVVARHGLRNVKKAQKMSILTGIIGTGAQIATGGSGLGQVASQASQVFAAGLLTKNSRDFEREADYLGLYTMVAAGYNADGMSTLFQRLQQASSSSKSSMGGIFASHPNAQERSDNTKREVTEHLAGIVPDPNSRQARRRAKRLAAEKEGQQGGPTDFAIMKQLLASYRSGNPRHRPTNDQQPNQQPAQNGKPVLTRQP